MTENWKPIPGFEGRYDVSDQGRVRSLRWPEPRILRPGRMPQGHVSVALGRNNSRCVHELVLLAFVGPKPFGMECCHNNGDPADNRLANLRWDTRGNNIRDKKWHGRPRKLTVSDVRQIKDGLSCHGDGAYLARKFGVAQCTISAIKNGRTHVDV